MLKRLDDILSSTITMISSLTPQALHHPYFFALPLPTLPSKLPKSASQASSRALEEVDGNVDLSGPGPSVKAALPNRLKRKLSSPSNGRSIARRLDFTQSKP